MVFSVLTRKSKVPRYNFHPPRSRSQPTGDRAQLAAPSGPGSHTLPSCHPWGSQASNPASPPLPQAAQVGETRSHRLRPRQLATALRSQRQGRENFTAASRPGPRLVEGLNEGFGAPQAVPWTLQLTHAQNWVSWRASRRRPVPVSYLTLHLMTTTPLILDWITSPMIPPWQLSVGHFGVDQWLRRTTDNPSLVASWLLASRAH